MKHIKKLLASVFVLAALSPCAYANNVSDINISVSVRDDASAYVIQQWTGEFDDGTENYIPIATGDIEISDLKVSDEKGEYQTLDSWNIDADFDEKSRKCGINETNGGVELCFGISDYGEKSYKIEYIVTDFIKGYTDYDGTNFMLVNPDMSTFPTNATVDISLENGTALDETNAAIWAFGFDGEIHFNDGHIFAYTNSALEGGNCVIVMFSLNKGIIAPKTELDSSFEDVKDTAFEGSDYGYDDSDYDYYDEEAGLLETIIGLIVIFGFFALFVLIIMKILKRRKEIKKFVQDANYFRDTPNGGNIEISHYLAQNFNIAREESLIMGAVILSMINKGSLEPITQEHIGAFGKVRQSVDLKLVHEPDTDIEKRLYNILISAAGSDGILQEKELEKYAYANPKLITNYISGAKSAGEAAFTAKGGFSGRGGNSISSLSETGKRELSEVVGLKKYLEEFSLISERSINETIIWQDYMVYATLFGIADKVIKQLEKVYPDRLPEFEDYYTRNVIIANSYYHSMHSSAQSALQAERTEGLGGSASIGGGGGFSGGGSGGGSR